MKLLLIFLITMGSGQLITSCNKGGDGALIEKRENLGRDQSESVSQKKTKAADSKENGGAEQQAKIDQPEFVETDAEAISTFSIDVDTASYSMMRATVNEGRLPSTETIRLEEWINYFSYNYADPVDQHPLAVYTERSTSPWDEAKEIIRIGIQAKKMTAEDRPATNLVFLVDVSGSMSNHLKLPLVKSTLKLMVPTLKQNDRFALVTYAGEAKVVLNGTAGDQHETIIAAIDALGAKGGTNGEGGIKEAYRLAAENFIAGGVNRVLIATDGDFNLGITSEDDLVRLIREKADEQIFLTVLGFAVYSGDHRLETLADQGNGQYAYIDSGAEARKVMVDNLMGTLVMLAKDTKIQVAFDSSVVKEYRLLGYDNRRLNNEDFANDGKDAGDVGVSQSVTALYEVVMQEGADAELPPATVKIRYKMPEAFESTEMSVAAAVEVKGFAEASSDHKFSLAVASLARGLKYQVSEEVRQSVDWAKEAIGSDLSGKRTEFIGLAEKIMALSGADQED